MDLQRLKYFVEVARQKHFSRAAEVCRVSQPSLSQQIKKLEGEVGGDLFQRSRGKVTLTELGESFLKHAQSILADVQSAEEFINRLQDEQQHILRVGCIPTIAPYVIPEWFRSIRSEYPSARLELMESFTESLTESLMTGRIDFALLSPPTFMDGECDHLTLIRDELLLTLPENDPLVKEVEITASSLANRPMILLENAHCLAGQTGAYCRELGLSEDVAIRSSQIETQLGLVEQGLGLSFTPAIAVKAHRHRKVVFRSISENPCYREIRLIWLKRQFLSKSHKSVLEGFHSLRAWDGLHHHQ
jgi:LysR family transcriptional regulator, hydrogen peroxide-inducible genes activator